MPMPLGFFSNDDPGLTSCFQVCSYSAYPQHLGELYRTNGNGSLVMLSP